MALDAALDHVRAHSHAALTTVRKDGSPQMSPLVECYRAVAGEHPDWDEYRDAMRAEQRCLIRVALTRAGPDVAG